VGTPAQSAALAALQQLVEERYRPTLPAFDPACPFNQRVDYITRRRGRFLYIMTIYETPERDGVRERFESSVARLENSTGPWFTLAWQRHTGQWISIEAGLALDDAIQLVRKLPLFEPEL
jgi:hypothetical protein